MTRADSSGTSHRPVGVLAAYEAGFVKPGD